MKNKFGLITILLAVSILGYFAFTSQAQQDPTATPQPPQAMSGMGNMGSMETDFSSDDLAPLVRGIFEGEEVLFIHTETSDPDISSLLTDMMGPEVVTVPNLAEIPDDLLGAVYVFTNGISGGGPLGFQPDIFDSVPDDDEYTPLRTLHLVTWQDDTTPRQLDSVAEIETAQNAQEIIIELPGVVINMPILVWANGQR